MGKKEKPVFEGIIFDSDEEIQFYIFLCDAKRLGIIVDFQYQPKSFLLVPKATESDTVILKSGKQKVKTKVIYREHSYTADFWVKVNPEKFYNSAVYKCSKVRLVNDEFYVDVKGTHNRHGGDRIFPIHQKLVFWKYHKHVNKIVPDDFFQAIGFIPERLRWIKGRKVKTLRPKYLNLRSLETIFENNQTQTNIGFLPNVEISTL